MTSSRRYAEKTDKYWQWESTACENKKSDGLGSSPSSTTYSVILGRLLNFKRENASCENLRMSTLQSQSGNLRVKCSHAVSQQAQAKPHRGQCDHLLRMLGGPLFIHVVQLISRRLEGLVFFLSGWCSSGKDHIILLGRTLKNRLEKLIRVIPDWGLLLCTS